MDTNEPSAPRSIAIIGTRGYPSYYGGFETAVRRIAPYLVDHGWDVTVYGRPGATLADDHARDHRVASRETRGLESRSLSTLTYGFTATLDALRRKPDVALVMNVANGFWLPLLKLRGIPTVVNVDGIEWERNKWSRLGKAVFLNGARLTARFATRLIFDAQAIAAKWREKFDADGDFIPYGGDARDELPLKDDVTSGQYALIVARFVPENTVAEFLDATDRIAREHDVVVVGSSGYGGELDEKAEALATTNPRVHWLGHVRDDDRLHALWQNAGAYFHGHSVGGTNPALVQAMALGAPVVARDTVYNREVLGEQGGVFVQPVADQIAEQITAVINDAERQQKMRATAMRRYREVYTWDSVCAAYEQSLLDVIDTKVRGQR